MKAGQDWAIAVVIATEVPPMPQAGFPESMIALAINAVCDVIRNRTASPLFPNTAVEVVLQRNQFSAVCREDYWRKAMAGLWFPTHVMRCLDRWRNPSDVIAPGATHYYSPISMLPPGKVPSWVSGMTEVIVPGLSQAYFRFYRP